MDRSLPGKKVFLLCFGHPMGGPAKHSRIERWRSRQCPESKLTLAEAEPASHPYGNSTTLIGSRQLRVCRIATAMLQFVRGR